MFEWLCIKASNICKQMLQYIFGVTVTTENISNATYQFRFDLADGLSKKHEVITVSCSVIRLPNNRFWSKAFHINRKINHLSPSPGCVSISHVFFHATTWIFGLTEYLHMESHLSLSLSLDLSWQSFMSIMGFSTKPDREMWSIRRPFSPVPSLLWVSTVTQNCLLGRRRFWVLFPP